MNNPILYQKFGGPRLRPGMDLLHRVIALHSMNSSIGPVVKIADLGCGSGQLTTPLVDAFPSKDLKIFAIDSSANMLAQAKKSIRSSKYLDHVSFQQNTFEGFTEDKSVPNDFDLIFSNSAFHWTENHDVLLPNLIHKLKQKSGILAFQIPDSRLQMSHTLMSEAAEKCGLTTVLNHVRIPQCQLDPIHYHNMLSPLVTYLDIWTTTYVQPLPVESTALHPIADFYSSTGLSVYLNALGGIEDEKSKSLLTAYSELLDEKYPPLTGVDGNKVVLLDIKRFFLVAQCR